MITTQTKVQLSSLLVALMLIGAAYLLFLPAENTTQKSPAEDSPYAISVESATYGENCTAFIEHNNKIRARSNPPKEALPPIQRNNSLRLISKTCSGNITCGLNISPQTVGFDPAPNCAKEMRITYRCFAFDTLRESVGVDGNEMLLNCELDG